MLAQLLKSTILLSVETRNSRIWGAETHEPVNLSRKTRRTKSSMECIIRSRMVEQSGSVASCFSFPDISCSAATKNRRRSTQRNSKQSLQQQGHRTYLRWGQHPRPPPPLASSPAIRGSARLQCGNMP